MSAPASDTQPGLRRRTKAALVGVSVVIVVGALGSMIPLPFAVLSPGPVTNTLGTDVDKGGAKVPRIAVKGKPTYPTTGELAFTTVSLEGGPGYPVSVWDWVGATLDDEATVLPADAVFPPQQTQEQVTAENQAEMHSSQDDATAVALRALGYDVPEHLVIREVAPTGPAHSALKAGDILTSVNGAPTSGADAVRAELAKVSPGSKVKVGVVRSGQALTLESGTAKSPEGRTILGIALGTGYDFPVTVTIDAGDVGGPSAGLMFSLGIYDVLTPGSLTGGKKIAGTGTIDASGRVGPIGGIKQKMLGAREAGSAYFLAPEANCEDVVGEVPDGLTVVKVGTFDEAKSAVEGIAAGQGSALPHC